MQGCVLNAPFTTPLCRVTAPLQVNIPFTSHLQALQVLRQIAGVRMRRVRTMLSKSWKCACVDGDLRTSTEQEQAADVAAVAVPLLVVGKWINGSVVTRFSYDTSTSAAL